MKIKNVWYFREMQRRKRKDILHTDIFSSRLNTTEYRSDTLRPVNSATFRLIDNYQYQPHNLTASSFDENEIYFVAYAGCLKLN